MNQAEGDVDRRVCERFFPERSGVLVEVGAARPDFLSIGAFYRNLGWRVISIEPNPQFCELHRQQGHELLEYACGDHDEDDVDFCVVDSRGNANDLGSDSGNISYESFSSLGIKESYAILKTDLHIRHIKVKLRRLDTILAEHAPDVSRIDLIAVDVEGWELEVLNGLSFNRYRPRVLIVENVFNEPRYWKYMRDHGYSLWRSIVPNDVYTIAPLTITERLRSFAFKPIRRLLNHLPHGQDSQNGKQDHPNS